MNLYKRQNNLAWQKLGEHTLLLESGTNKMAHHLDDLGSFLWNLLENKISEKKLSDKILETYEIDEKTAHNDVESFLKKLISLNLVEKFHD